MSGGFSRGAPAADRTKIFVPFDNSPRPMISCASLRRSIRYIPVEYSTPAMTARSSSISLLAQTDLGQREDNGEHHTNHRQKDTDIEGERRADVDGARADRDPSPHRRHERPPEEYRRHAARERHQQTDAQQRCGIHHEGAACGGHAVGHDVQHEGRGNDQTADESPAGFVVPAQEQKQRKEHQQRHQEARRRPQDQRAHRLRSFPIRSSALTPIATVTSTVVSPNVSKPLKSTRITLTTLRPCASRGAASAKYAESLDVVPDAPTNSTRVVTSTPAAAATIASRTRTAVDERSPN